MKSETEFLKIWEKMSLFYELQIEWHNQGFPWLNLVLLCKWKDYREKGILMITSKFKKLNIEPSKLGFGCMRFPTNEDGSIDEMEAQKLLDTAYEGGVTYFDTARP